MRKILASRRILCSYSLEDTRFVIGEKTAFAMVSMCNLPFSELSSYLNKYGGYTLGLSREWGLRNKFNPIWYCDPESMAVDSIRDTIGRIRQTNKDNESLLLVSNILSYIKMVEGDLSKRNYSRYRFYDERECRFVPSFLYMLSGGEKLTMDENEYLQYKEDHQGTTILNYGVEFEWEDLKYIIVKEEKQIQPLRDYLIRMGCPNDAVQLFFNKQVVEDFIGENHNEIKDIAFMIQGDKKNRVR